MSATHARAGDIGADAAMTVAKHKAIAAASAWWRGPVRRAATTLFYENPFVSSLGIKDVADVNLDWTALASSWSFVALDRMAWAWSSARRHRRRAQELYFICPNRDRAPDQRGADAVALARQLVRL
jgi:hypothetical protein